MYSGAEEEEGLPGVVVLSDAVQIVKAIANKVEIVVGMINSPLPNVVLAQMVKCKSSLASLTVRRALL